METISRTEARRLALTRAGLLKPEWTGFPSRATGHGLRARKAAHEVIRRFGYLQLDTVSVAGARSHAIVLLSRLERFDPEFAEELLQPTEPLFEYWGHEVCWMPLDFYPLFAWRRRRFRQHPWWGDLVGKHPQVADELLRRIRNDGPIRSLDMEGRGGAGWWNLKLTKRVATALWSSGELAISERKNFQRTFDLAERVIPEEQRTASVLDSEAIERLLLLALQGHGWATTGTLALTWRIRNQRSALISALESLAEKQEILPCTLILDAGKKTAGWIRPSDLELAARLRRVRPRSDRGVLLSPFDPVLWERKRVQQLFGFDQVLEVFKPAPIRVYGYYCLPVLAGERLVARVDLKAHRKKGKLEVLSCRFEESRGNRACNTEDYEATRVALVRYSDALSLKLVGWKGRRCG